MDEFLKQFHIWNKKREENLCISEKIHEDTNFSIIISECSYINS